MSFMAVSESILAFVQAVHSGDQDTALRLLSPYFKIHDGLDRRAYAEHEIREFKRRLPYLRLPLEVRLIEQSGSCQHIALYDASQHFVYEDWLHLGPDNLLVGNGDFIEMVPKLHFHADGSISRGMALRTRTGKLSHVHVITPCTSHYRFDCVSSSQEEDGASHLSFVINDDDLLGRDGEFRCYVETRRGLCVSRQTRYLRGIDHPCFTSGMYPRIDGCYVSFEHDMANAWSLTVELESGKLRTIEAPSGEPIEFDEDVRHAILTDAIDNDWEGIHAS